MLISRDPAAARNDGELDEQLERQHRQAPHSAGSITSPLVRGMKRQMNFDFAEPSSPQAACVTCCAADGNGGNQQIVQATPDFGRLLENMTQASIYQKRMRRRNSSGCPKATLVEASTTATPAAEATTTASLGDAVGQAGGYKKYLRDRYLSSREDSSAASASIGGGNSSSSHPSVDLDSDPFTPPSAPPVVRQHQYHLHHLLAAAAAAAADERQHRLCQSAPHTPQEGSGSSVGNASGAASAASPPPALFLFPPHRRLADPAAVASGVAPTTPGRSPGRSAVGGGNDYLCTECGRTFNRSDMLNRHARLHSNTRPYVCHLCPQAFSRSDHLSTHMRTHTGDKPYSCSVCSYSACRRDMITRHMKIHRKHAASSNASSCSSSGGDRSPQEAMSPS